jgi:lipoyl(octanoyl) transferase
MTSPLRSPSSTLLLRRLGLQPYESTWQAMMAFTSTRTADTPDELWLVEHPPVFTQGLNGKPEHVLAPDDIPVLQVDRGGQITYHGPGQLIAYPLIDLARTNIGIKDFVSRLEDAVIALLAEFDITAARRPGAPGVFVGSNKIAALGLRVRRGRSYHGLSLNVAMDLQPFSRIRPCGLTDTGVTQMAALTPRATMAAVVPRLVSHLGAALGYTRIRDCDGEPVAPPA